MKVLINWTFLPFHGKRMYLQMLKCSKHLLLFNIFTYNFAVENLQGLFGGW